MQRPASRRGVHCGSGGLKGEKVELLLQAHKSILSEDWPLSRMCILLASTYEPYEASWGEKKKAEPFL